ncbi:MAG: hypothetical protein HRU30_15390 [Rhodobacteraceae bacterium]|nr:hypothetical protein [Paracoccaceae bacterium]
MKLAFLTMVWQDYWLLQKWVEHNEKVVPRRQLYVLNHGGDPEVDRIAEGCNVMHIPRDGVTIDLTRRRWDLVAGVTNGLQAFFDLVICTDVDELIVTADPDGNLGDYLAARDFETEALSPVGLNLMPSREEDAPEDAPVLAQFPHALLSARYTKPCITQRPVTYTIGGHGLIGGRFEIDPNLLLYHLHYVTPDYKDRMAARQDIVREGKERNERGETNVDVPNRFWINWSRPNYTRDKEFRRYDEAEEMDVTGGFQACADKLNAAVRNRGRKMLVKPAALEPEGIKVEVPKALRGVI